MEYRNGGNTTHHAKGMAFSVEEAEGVEVQGSTITAISDASDADLTIKAKGAGIFTVGNASNETHIALAMDANTTTGLITKGGSRFLHNYADTTSLGVNTFLGVLAGNFTMSPGGGANTLASYNTGIGGGVLAALTTGYGNTAVGGSALNAVTTGFFNTAIGVDALAFTTITGSNNTGVGGDAIYSLTSGVNNTGLGVRNLWHTTDGSENVAVGFDALYTNVGGDKNVAVGNQALYLATGNNNIAIGYNAGDNITTGTDNIIIGFNIDAASATANGQLNIGGAILGNVSSQALQMPGTLALGSTSYADAGVLRLRSGANGIIAWRNEGDSANATLQYLSDHFTFTASAVGVGFLIVRNNATNLTAKTGRLVTSHYTNSEEPLGIISGTSDSGAQSVFIGGGSSAVNAARTVAIFTGATDTTTTGTQRMTWDESGNVGLGVTAFGTSAVKVLGIGNGTEPSTSPADMVQLYSVDLSADNATLGLRTETAVVTESVVSDRTLSIRINGTTYKVCLKA